MNFFNRDCFSISSLVGRPICFCRWSNWTSNFKIGQNQIRDQNTKTEHNQKCHKDQWPSKSLQRKPRTSFYCLNSQKLMRGICQSSCIKYLISPKHNQKIKLENLQILRHSALKAQTRTNTIFFIIFYFTSTNTKDITLLPISLVRKKYWGCNSNVRSMLHHFYVNKSI